MKKTSRDLRAPAASRKNIESRLQAYSALGGAAIAAAALGTTTAASAQTIVPLVAGDFSGTLSANRLTPGQQFVAAHFALGGFHLTANGLVTGFPPSSRFASIKLAGSGGVKIAGHSSNIVSRLGVNVALSPASPPPALFAGGNLFRTFSNVLQPGSFVATANQPATGYIAFQKGANATYLGWLHLTVNAGANGKPLSFAITPGPNTGSYVGAYVINGSILTGQTATAIPEPATVASGLALFALGAVGVREHRRRRQAAA